MTPARRKILERIRRGGAKKKRFSLKKILIVLLLFGALFVVIKTQTRVWNGKEKVSVVVAGTNKVVISVFDPGTSEITNIYIPGETQVDAARELGTFRIKNIWRLGENEKIGGVLLSETV